MTVTELIVALQELVIANTAASDYEVLVPIDHQNGEWGQCGKPDAFDDDKEVLL